MIKAGITCFCDVGYFPSDIARLAVSQGLRVAIGLPVAEHPSPWAQNAGEYLSRALRLRDDYKGHPTISVSFAPLRPAEMADATFARLSVLVNELDAGVLLALHESQGDVDESVGRRGVRPIERLERLGLLTPALTAAHAQALDPRDLELAQRAGIGVALCLASGLLRCAGLPPISALAPLRLGLGSDGDTTGAGQDLWTEIKLFALHAPAAAPAGRTGSRHARRRRRPRSRGRDRHARGGQMGRPVLCRSRRPGDAAAPGSAAATGFLGRPRPGERCLGGGPSAPMRGSVHSPRLAGAGFALAGGRPPRDQWRLLVNTTNPSSANADPAELAKFAALAQRWWDPERAREAAARSESAAPAIRRARRAARGPRGARRRLRRRAFCPRRWRAAAPGCSASISRPRCSRSRSCMPRTPG